ncbi:MAG: hypothetical protein ACQEXQ_16085 [Bacillota bacterium]
MSNYISKQALIDWLRYDGDVPSPKEIIRVIKSGEFDVQLPNQQELATGLEPLTSRQAEVFDFIVAYDAEHRSRPSVRQVMAGVGHSSESTTHGVIKRLMEKGYLKRVSKYDLQITGKREEATDALRRNRSGD